MKKAFTLVELLAVIIIIGIISVIVVPKVINLITENKNKVYNDQIEKIENAANLYATEHSYDITFSGGNAYISLNDLVNGGYLETPIINQKTGENFDLDDTVIKITKTNEKYEFSVLFDGIPYKIYGVRFDPTDGVIGTRTDDAIGLNYHEEITDNKALILSDFDNEEIYSEIIEVTDNYGNQFIKIPKIYIKKTKIGGIWTYQISKKKQDENYYLPYCFNQNGQILPYILVGKYIGSLSTENKLESKTGRNPKISVFINSFRNYAKANGTEYGIIDIHTIDVLQTLFYIEFATLDSQTIFQGYTSSTNSNVIINGTADVLDTEDKIGKTGSPVSNTSGLYVNKYRGIENIWGNLRQYVDGININNYRAYVSTNMSTYQADVFTGDYKALNYVNSITNPSYLPGYSNEMGYDSNYPFAQFPSITLSTKPSYYNDGYYIATGTRVAVFGGGYKDNTLAGISFWNFYYANSYNVTNFGSRLIKLAI